MQEWSLIVQQTTCQVETCRQIQMDKVDHMPNSIKEQIAATRLKHKTTKIQTLKEIISYQLAHTTALKMEEDQAKAIPDLNQETSNNHKYQQTGAWTNTSWKIGNINKHRCKTNMLKTTIKTLCTIQCRVVGLIVHRRILELKRQLNRRNNKEA